MIKFLYECVLVNIHCLFNIFNVHEEHRLVHDSIKFKSGSKIISKHDFAYCTCGFNDKRQRKTA